MGKKLLAFVFIIFSISSYAQTRPGSLKGVVTDSKTGETVPFANVVIKDNAGNILKGGATDFDGKYNLNPVNPGTYTVEVSFQGYATFKQNGVKISANSVTFLDFKMKEATKELKEVVITYKAPLIDKDKSSTITTTEDFVNMAVRNVSAVATQTPGVTSDGAGGINIRGARAEGTLNIVDGVKMRGNPNIPQQAIAQTEVIIGGVPAQFGDAVGGVINTTTRGPQGTFFGGAEIFSSVPFDDWDFTLGALTLGGPIYKNEKGEPIIGFLFAGEYSYSVDAPSAIPYLRLNEDTLQSIRTNPVIIDPSGNSVQFRSEFVDNRSLSRINARDNNWNNQLRLNGNVQFKTSDLTTLTVGGLFVFDDDKVSSYTGHIFNNDANLSRVRYDWNTYVRFQQQFRNSEDQNSLIKNAYYTIQADYSRINTKTFDPRFEEDFFKYGYVGSFDRQSTRAYVYSAETDTAFIRDADGNIIDQVITLPGHRFVGLADTNLAYTPAGLNADREAYTYGYYQLAEQFPSLSTRTIEDLRALGVPVNGDNPASVYGLWASSGSQNTVSNNPVRDYSKGQFSQFRVTASTNFDVKDHQFTVGFEYEQRTDRSFSVNARGLWTQMRLLQNQPNSQLDLNNPISIFDEFGFYRDTVEYNFLYSETDASSFSENVRSALGLDPTGVDQINIDNLDPSIFSLDMFSADELVNPSGNSFVSYNGYDYTGELQSGNPTIGDFFNEVDENGRKTRPIGAYQPIYIAGYIQDKFTYNDLTFNVGVRLDRFDLNQSVLKDPYLLYPTYTVSDLGNSELASSNIPASIGGDYVVYVNTFDYTSDDLRIVGYRDGDNWFDASGNPLADPATLSNLAGGGIKPFINPDFLEFIGEDGGSGNASSADVNDVPVESFKDYEPQVVVMPRVAFQFPITDEALFVAHYDVLAQRPTTGARLNPFNYLGLANRATTFINNPDLRPQRNTSYEIGFKQTLTNKTAVKIASFYREQRDLIQVQSFNEAHPITYVSYGNRDFSTIKGFSLEFEMRRTNNVKINANYTLQFAEGTGSNGTSGLSIAQTGQPNLRFLQPLNFDRRHQIQLILDYRYASGSFYNGPLWFNKRVLENFGINISMSALSGEPYSARQTSYVLTANPSNAAQLEGSINGSRLPWQVNFDARISKGFTVNKEKRQTMEVYLQILNVLNTRNVTNVYPFTGSPDDDGFLVSPTAQAQLAEQASAQAYVDLYNNRVNSPFNFSLPRRVRLGISYNF